MNLVDVIEDDDWMSGNRISVGVLFGLLWEKLVFLKSKGLYFRVYQKKEGLS